MGVLLRRYWPSLITKLQVLDYRFEKEVGMGLKCRLLLSQELDNMIRFSPNCIDELELTEELLGTMQSGNLSAKWLYVTRRTYRHNCI